MLTTMLKAMFFSVKFPQSCSEVIAKLGVMPNNTLASTKATFSQVFLNLKHLVHVMSHTCPAAEDYIQ